jgi:hypothetical protein
MAADAALPGRPEAERGADEARNPYLFVVGVARSGTTLLQRMLDSHPQLAVSNDPAFTHVPLRHLPDGVDPPLTSELVESTLALRTFHRLGLEDAIARQAASGARTWSEFVSRLYDALARQAGKPFAGEKMARYVTHLPQLTALFPWARFVHIIRDGRDVALSNLEWAHDRRGPGRLALWDEEPVAVSALSWRWMVTAGMHDGAALGPRRYHEVRYEKLLDRPAAALRQIASFLDLPFSDRMLAYHEGKVRAKPGLSAKQAWLPPTPGLRDWRAEMRPRDLELFEAIAGDLLTRLGYERSFERISPEIAGVAERCRAWWQREHRRSRVPREGPYQAPHTA